MNVSVRRFSALTATLAGAGALALAPSALGQGPQEVGVGGGTTILQLDGSTASALSARDISVIATRRAGTSGLTSRFPITGGEVEPNTGTNGIFRHAGGLLFKSAEGSAVVRNFVVTTGKTLRAGGTLTARAGSQRVTLGRLDGRSARVIRRAPGNVGTWIVRLDLRMSRGAATLLNRALETNVFAAGLLIGRVDVRSTPSDVILTGGTTTLAPAPGLIPALTGAGITPTPQQPAAFLDGNVTFPVVSGQWAVSVPPTAFTPGNSLPAGDILHGGALQLANGASVTLSQLTIEGGDGEAQLAAVVNGSQNVPPILDLGYGRARQGLSNGQLVITGLPATVLDSTAQVVNQAFGRNLLQAGQDFGTMRVQAKVL